ncbi:MAG: nucleotidyltransferase family protein [Gemmatimonadota bacterium]|nr:nucleotidyltransferase family protein [Gemmatimonadota bacterium]
MNSNTVTTKVVILARGLGTRMRKADDEARLEGDQAAAAELGIKAMIPIGRPFLDYVLTEVADAGFTDACLVIGPEHQGVRDHYEREMVPSRLRVRFAVQEHALGTANAVLAADDFAAGDTFVVLNSDNYYPSVALEELHRLRKPAIAGFDRETLVRSGNVSAERTSRFGALDMDESGHLRRILAAPNEEMLRAGTPIYSSMNCFLFTSEIFTACREVPLSARGEYELPQAVHWAIDKRQMRFKVVRVSQPVLDLSTRADIAGVAEHLRDVAVNL